MANSKNTIQNIPLEGELCMNSLKTEVKPFAGYNEKNTTFYGGTLSPIYDKTTELFDKNKSYTFFNSKGVPYTVSIDRRLGSSRFILYKNGSLVQGFEGTYFSETEKLDVPSDTIAATKIGGKVLYVSKNTGSIVLNGNTIASFDVHSYNQVLTSKIWITPAEQVIVIIVGELNYSVFYIYSGQLVSQHTFDESLGSSPFISGRRSGNKFFITAIPSSCFMGGSGIIKGDALSGVLTGANVYRITIDTSVPSISKETTTEVFIEHFDDDGYETLRLLNRQDIFSINLQQYAWRALGNTEYGCKELFLRNLNHDTSRLTGNNGYDVGCPLGYNKKQASIYYQDGSLISIGFSGLPIDECLSYASNIVTRNLMPYEKSFTYKKKDGAFYCFKPRYIHNSYPSSDKLEQFVFDNRYIIFKNLSHASIYDTETDEIIPKINLDWIISYPPVVTGTPDTTTGAVFCGGVNAGYTISGVPFVGYLPNPFVLENFPVGGEIEIYQEGYYFGLSDKFSCIQNYCSIGDTVQSAEYFGKDPQYQGTIYPIDPNGNVVLPVSQNAELIKGYSNNDLVKEGNTVYPLMYWNNNQKTYTYMLLSGMENITNAFSLQGQQYTVDDDNIYAVSFNAGVIQNATAVAYKRNLTFLGTLPTQAVFWSDFNKTFYAFTGDRILSRMFEASDINKIEYVGQNPATLSLWICTDDGIYVLSDKDMFKLDYNSKQVAFYSKNAFIVTEGATNNEVHTISLYLNDDEQGEMVPVKLQTAYYGLGSEQKAVMDCWYLRLFDKDRTEGYVKVKVNTITDVTRHTEEKTFNISPSDYDDNNIVYIRYQPKYQECVSMQLELETNLGIYSMSLGVNTTDSTAQVSKFNF